MDDVHAAGINVITDFGTQVRNEIKRFSWSLAGMPFRADL